MLLKSCQTKAGLSTHQDLRALTGKLQANQVFGVCGVARYDADITGSLKVLTYLFPFCSEVLVLLQVTRLPALCHLILKILFQPTGCSPISPLAIKQPHIDSEHFVTLSQD